MIQEFVQAWDKNKHLLQKHIEEHEMSIWGDYGDLVKALFEIVINPYRVSKEHWDNEAYDLKHMTTIDDGDYQGTVIYIIPKDTYQPSVRDYVMTYASYGSCSGCDTLLGIIGYDYDKKPTEGQVKELMSLCLHLLQKCKYLGKDEG